MVGSMGAQMVDLMAYSMVEWKAATRAVQMAAQRAATTDAVTVEWKAA
jgi:hypothetical protein